MIEGLKHILAHYSPRPVLDQGLVPAGVLLLLYQREGEYHALFTKRTERVQHHKGEVSFPGGVQDAGDESTLATALRETQEELGVLPQDVEVLGALDQVRTKFGFRVSPFVGTIPYPYPFAPSGEEIDQLLEVPLSTLLATEEHARIQDPAGLTYDGVVYRFGGHLIFGATARIVKQFLDLCWRPLIPPAVCGAVDGHG